MGVELNIGGRIFSSDREIFLKAEGSYFHALLTSGLWHPENGAHFIDRDPANFDRIMRTLRTGCPIDFEGLTEAQAVHMQEEVDYYQLSFEKVQSFKRLSGNVCSEWQELSEIGCTFRCPWSHVKRRCGQVIAPNVPSFKIRVHEIDERGEIWVGYAKSVQQFVPNCLLDGLFLTNTGSVITCESHINSGHSGFDKNDIVEILFCKSSFTISAKVSGSRVRHVGTFECDDVVLLPTVVINGGTISLHSLSTIL